MPLPWLDQVFAWEGGIGVGNNAQHFLITTQMTHWRITVEIIIICSVHDSRHLGLQSRPRVRSCCSICTQLPTVGRVSNRCQINTIRLITLEAVSLEPSHRCAASPGRVRFRTWVEAAPLWRLIGQSSHAG